MGIATTRMYVSGSMLDGGHSILRWEHQRDERVVNTLTIIVGAQDLVLHANEDVVLVGW